MACTAYFAARERTKGTPSSRMVLITKTKLLRACSLPSESLRVWARRLRLVRLELLGHLLLGQLLFFCFLLGQLRGAEEVIQAFRAKRHALVGNEALLAHLLPAVGAPDEALANDIKTYAAMRCNLHGSRRHRIVPLCHRDTCDP